MVTETQVQRALILSGGGSRGAYEAGVVAQLAENGVAFDIVSGTSIGAINGFAVAQGLAARLEELWKEVADPRHDVAPFRREIAWAVDLFKDARDAFGPSIGHVKDSPLAQAMKRLAEDASKTVHDIPTLGDFPRLRQLLGLLDGAPRRKIIEEYANFDDLQSTLILGVTDLTASRGGSFAYFPPEREAQRQAFFNEQCLLDQTFGDQRMAEPLTKDNYVDAICASAALPPAFEPVSIRCANDPQGREHLFVDGAFTSNTPLGLAIDAGATEIVAIQLGPVRTSSTEHPVHHLGHVIRLALEANTNHTLDLERRLVERINRQIASGEGARKRTIDVTWVAPKSPITLDPLDFREPEKIGALIGQGRRDAEEAWRNRLDAV